jgi:nucleoside-diphosphate-sugar epimerase
VSRRYSRILVTGGAGFIGSHLVDRLLSEDFKVYVIDNLNTGHLENIAHHQDKKEFHFIKGDIRDHQLVKQTISDVDVVFHEAALTSVALSMQDPILTNDVNVSGTLALLKLSLDLGVKRFIYASSAAVYGDTASEKEREDMTPNPTSPYGASKLAAENYIRLFNTLYGLETVSLRYFNVYGPRQPSDVQSPYSAAIAIFINRLLRNMPPIIYGDGEQTRDFIYIEDVVEANMLALNARNAVGEIFNVATGVNVSVNYVANTLKKIMNREHIENVYTAARQGDIRHSTAEIGKAKKLLGFHPRIRLEEGLAKLVDWFKTSVDYQV